MKHMSDREHVGGDCEVGECGSVSYVYVYEDVDVWCVWW